MSVRVINYKDLTPAQRAKGAAEARQRLQSLLSNPYLPAEQRAAIHAQMAKLDLWEKGALPEAPSAPKALPPVEHKIEVTETVTIADKAG